MIGIAVLRGNGTTCEITTPPISLPKALNRGSMPTTEKVRNWPPKPALRIFQIKATDELNRLTKVIACGWIIFSWLTAESTLSLFTGEIAEGTSAGRFKSASAWLTAASPVRPMASTSANIAMRSWLSVAQSCTTFYASSTNTGQT